MIMYFFFIVVTAFHALSAALIYNARLFWYRSNFLSGIVILWMLTLLVCFSSPPSLGPTCWCRALSDGKITMKTQWANEFISHVFITL